MAPNRSTRTLYQVGVWCEECRLRTPLFCVFGVEKTTYVNVKQSCEKGRTTCMRLAVVEPGWLSLLANVACT